MVYLLNMNTLLFCVYLLSMIVMMVETNKHFLLQVYIAGVVGRLPVWEGAEHHWWGGGGAGGEGHKAVLRQDTSPAG